MNRHLLRSATLALALAALTACGDSTEATADTPVSAPSDTPSTSPPPEPAVAPTPEPAPAPAEPTPETYSTVPTLFHGEWNRVLADCNTDKNDSRLRIAADTIIFHEGSGKVVEATQDGNELDVVVQLSADGNVVDRRLSYELAGNRQALTDNGSGLVRLRCVFHPKDPAATPAPAPAAPPQG